MEHKFMRSEQNPGAVINTDVSALQAYKARKKLAEEQKQKMERMETELSEIKMMLKQLLSKESK